jgi:hypothetical protein
MAGVRLLSGWQMGKESTKGTPVAATRQWYPDALAPDIDRMLALHRGNRGTNTALAHATSMGVMVDLPYTSDPDIGLAYDELPFVLSQLDGGESGANATDDKDWTFEPTQTSQDTTREAYTIEIFDDVQNYEFEYCQASDFTISASRDSMTQLAVNWFGRQSTKSTKTAVAANQAVRIPGYLWKVRFATAQSGLSGASDQTNFLLDFDLNTRTGLVRRKYMDGLTYFGQTVAAQEIGATLTMHVESTSTAVSQFYDKHAAQTIDFIQLAATGPTLGSGTYIAQVQLAVLYTSAPVLQSEDEGVNIYEVTAETVIDPTWAQSMAWEVTASIASIT